MPTTHEILLLSPNWNNVISGEDCCWFVWKINILISFCVNVRNTEFSNQWASVRGNIFFKKFDSCYFYSQSLFTAISANFGFFKSYLSVEVFVVKAFTMNRRTYIDKTKKENLPFFSFVRENLQSLRQASYFIW